MSIDLITNFKLNSPQPLDDRYSVQNLTDIPSTALYEGMLIYQRSDKNFYKYENGKFLILEKVLSNTDIAKIFNNDTEIQNSITNKINLKIADNIPKISNSTINGNIKINDVESTIYSHPTNHPATIITETDIKKFVSDEEKNKWNNKQNYLGFTPENIENKTKANGYASLDNNGKIPIGQLPDLAKSQTFIVANSTERTAIKDMINGDRVYETTTGNSYIYNGNTWLVLAKADWENINLQWSNIENIPSNIKFTDTIYTHPSTHSADMITETTNRKIMTDIERNKLAGIDSGANKYTHPSTHPASIINQDEAHRFTTDIEKGAITNHINNTSIHQKIIITDVLPELAKMEENVLYLIKESSGA